MQTRALQKPGKLKNILIGEVWLAGGQSNMWWIVSNAMDGRSIIGGGEVIRATGPDLNWGLHLLDVDHSMGDLIRIAGKQAAAWTKAH